MEHFNDRHAPAELANRVSNRLIWTIRSGLSVGRTVSRRSHTRRNSTCGFFDRRKRQTACKPGSVPHPKTRRRSFLWTGHCWTVLATYPDAWGGEPCGPEPARRPYLVLLQAGLAMPPTLPPTRWALTPPFHPCLPRTGGGLLSVALSLGSPRAEVIRRLFTVEPGLSSTRARNRFLAPPRPPGRLTWARWARKRRRSTLRQVKSVVWLTAREPEWRIVCGTGEDPDVANTAVCGLPDSASRGVGARSDPTLDRQFRRRLDRISRNR